MLTSNQCKQIVSHLLIDCQWEEEKPVLARGKIAGTAIFFDRSKQTILPAFKNASFLDNQHDFSPDEQSIFDYYTVNTSLQVTQPPSPAHCTTCICRFHTVCIRQPALSLRIGKLLSLSDEQSQHDTSRQYLSDYIEMVHGTLYHHMSTLHSHEKNYSTTSPSFGSVRCIRYLDAQLQNRRCYQPHSQALHSTPT